MSNKILVLCAALVSLVVMTAPAHGGSVPSKVDFSGTGGTIAYTEGFGNPFQAEGGVNLVTRLPEGNHFSITGGSLGIVTGGCDNVNPKSCYTTNGLDELVLKFADSGPSGITITGAIPALGIASTTLLTGELIDTGAVLRGPKAPHPNSGGLSAEIQATSINIQMLKDMGFTNIGNTSNSGKSINQLDFILNAVIQAPNTNGKGILIGGLGNEADSSITLTDITITPVPEPTSLLLLGTSFLLGAGLLRRRLLANRS